MRNVRLGLWAGIAGIATIMIVGGKTVWMVSIITGLIIGLLLGSNDKITTPREGLRAGAIQGVSNLGIHVEMMPAVITSVVVLALALLTSLVAVRRVLRLDPLSATTGAGIAL